MSGNALVIEKLVQAPVSQVYRAFTNATMLREWLCDVATVNPQQGGRIYMAWNQGYYMSGEYTSLKPNQEVAFTWFGRKEPGESQVKVSFQDSAEGNLVRLEHGGFGEGQEWDKVRQEAQEGWELSLDNLVSVMETGEDLRFTKRPMLGIMIGEYNEKVAERLGVPVSKGIRLDGVVDGMGAQAAGLQNDDVIVAINERAVSDWGSISDALQRQQAGDTVEVTYYQGGEKKVAEMTLSGRPMREIPATAQELAEAVRIGQKDILSQLDDFLSGVTEEEASYKPAPEEWSLKENLAHLIHGERYTQFWIGQLIGGQEQVTDDWDGNPYAQVAATVSAYPNLADLVQEYQRSMAESTALLANLPDEFIARKGSYWRLAYNSLEENSHFYGHVEQMRTLVETARQAG
jgi:uncharacterized protein YndB with AHSA1/START domain